ncbi:hypothetical protein [Parabacteroides johnsonii]|nr:hypothetical protein [Parabacteroides johnsonii]
MTTVLISMTVVFIQSECGSRSNEDGHHGDKDRLHGKEVSELLGISANC